jgi:hypothetical protein
MAPHNFQRIWGHPERARIEMELARGVPPPIVAKRFGVSRTSAYRLRRKLPAQLRAASMLKRLRSDAELELLRTEESSGLLANLATQRARLLLVQDAAMEAGDTGKTVFASQAIHRNLELVGKYLGEFAAVSVQTNISILISPEYLKLRQQLLTALKPFPEARQAVAQALHNTEAQVADPTPPMIDVTAAEETNAATNTA